MSIYDICSCDHPRGVHLVSDPSTGSCDLRNCRCRGFVLAPSVKEQLRDSKQREAALIEREAGWAKTLELAAIQVESLTLERNAARNALGIARTAVVTARKRLCHYPQCAFDGVDEIPCNCGYLAVAESLREVLKTTADPTAVLAERDRATLRKGSDWLDEHYGYEIAAAFIGEFNLDPKPEGE